MWHMPTYVGGVPGALPERPLSTVYDLHAVPIFRFTIGMCSLA